MSIKLNILAENRAKKRGILAEHGLSMMIEVDGFKVLFDTGQTNVFSKNAFVNGIDISEVDALVISHGHYDHTGGVPEFCKLNKIAAIYMHPDALAERYNSAQGKPVGDSISIPWKNDYEGIFDDRIVFTKDKISIHERIFLSGEIPEREDLPRKFTNFVKRKDIGGFDNDKVMDEQFIIVKGNKGIYLFAGCSHTGILNCVSYAKELFSGYDVCGIIGGMHLEKHTDEQLNQIIAGFRSLGVQKIIPMHCTGIWPSCFIKNSFKDNCILLNSGDTLILEE